MENDWWMYILSCSWWSRTERVMQRSWDLAPWSEPMRGYWLSLIAAEGPRIPVSLDDHQESRSRGVDHLKLRELQWSPEIHMWIPDTGTRIWNVVVALETPRCNRCQRNVLTAKESCQQGVELSQKKGFCCTQQRWKKSGSPEDYFNMRHRYAVFGVCPASFLSWFGY